MHLVWKNPNPPIHLAFALSKVETYPDTNDRTYYAVFPQGSAYYTIQTGRKFSMRQFLGGTN